MGYDQARAKMLSYRTSQVESMMGESPHTWFAEEWGDVNSMLEAFKSDQENQEIAGKYASAPNKDKIAPHLKLDYVCALRRDVRKQYISAAGNVCTDVTPFRHGIMSAHGAQLFDNLLNTVMTFSSGSGG